MLLRSHRLQMSSEVESERKGWRIVELLFDLGYFTYDFLNYFLMHLK